MDLNMREILVGPIPMGPISLVFFLNYRQQNRLVVETIIDYIHPYRINRGYKYLCAVHKYLILNNPHSCWVIEVTQKNPNLKHTG